MAHLTAKEIHSIHITLRAKAFRLESDLESARFEGLPHYEQEVKTLIKNYHELADMFDTDSNCIYMEYM